MKTWRDFGRPLVLASQSPRRKWILSLMGVDFQAVRPGEIDEASFIRGDDLGGSLQELARRKARSVASRFPDSLVLAADTIVVCDGVVMGKPRDAAEASAMLSRLSAREHMVYSGVALVNEETGFTSAAAAKTVVSFRPIGDDEIREYLLTDEYHDKAGAYGIQGRALVFVDRIEGCFYNVVGLPVSATINLFNEYARNHAKGRTHA